MRKPIASFVFLISLPLCANTQDRSYGRSMVVTDRGIVATSHVLASQAGARVLGEYAKERAALINPAKANCTPVSGKLAKSDTTYLAAVDQDGNIASLIQSNYDYFGSGVVVRGMGFALQNRGALFVLDANDADALGPHKRPFDTIIPAFMERGDIHNSYPTSSTMK